jgi:hypothetical protein
LPPCLPGQYHHDKCLPIFRAQETIGHKAHIAVDQRQQIQQIGQIHVEDGVDIVGEKAIQNCQNALGQFGQLQREEINLN